MTPAVPECSLWPCGHTATALCKPATRHRALAAPARTDTKVADQQSPAWGAVPPRHCRGRTSMKLGLCPGHPLPSGCVSCPQGPLPEAGIRPSACRVRRLNPKISAALSAEEERSLAQEDLAASPTSAGRTVAPGSGTSTGGRVGQPGAHPLLPAQERCSWHAGGSVSRRVLMCRPATHAAQLPLRPRLVGPSGLLQASHRTSQADRLE